MFAEDDDRGLTREQRESVRLGIDALQSVVFHRYWLAVPHFGILKADAWDIWLRFLRFWSAYPRKTAKVTAWKAWLKMQPPLAAVINALAWQVECEQWTKDDGAYIPMPATYLNQMRHEDECPYSARELPEIKSIDAKRYTADGELIEGGEDA